MKQIKIAVLFAIMVSLFTHAHDDSATATYLGNEGVMIQSGESKIVFDPFFHNNYNHYQLVPEEIRKALFDNTPPYDNIDAIFISHAHGDHFAADDMLRFLKTHPKVKLVAPAQAIEKLSALKSSQSVLSQTKAIKLSKGDAPKTITLDDLLIEVVRIPHAGWPGRAEISNLVFRVTLEENITIMHMGDADPNDEHFKPYKDYWQKNLTNVAFPPYWFFTSESGKIILDERINATNYIGIHVPIKVPLGLQLSGEVYFSKPSEVKAIEHKHEKNNAK